MLEKLLNLPDWVYHIYIIKQDIYCQSIRKEDYSLIFKKCQEICSKALDYNYKELEKELEIVELDSNNPMDYVLFGEYDDTVKLYINNIRKIEDYIVNNRIKINKNFKAIVKAHEIFHYLEEKYSFETDDWKYKTKGLFKREKSLSLQSPSEISANIYTKNINKLDYNPVIYDYISTLVFNEKESVKMAKKLLAIYENYKNMYQSLD